MAELGILTNNNLFDGAFTLNGVVLGSQSRRIPALKLIREMFGGELFSRERPLERASNSEIRRWLENRSILIDGRRPSPDELVSEQPKELVFFPDNPKSRITIL